MAEEEDNTKKTNSRKFVVWLIWTILTIIALAIITIVTIVTKSMSESVYSIMSDLLKYYFYISGFYIGGNVLQKVGFAVSEAVSNKTEEK